MSRFPRWLATLVLVGGATGAATAPAPSSPPVPRPAHRAALAAAGPATPPAAGAEVDGASETDAEARVARLELVDREDVRAARNAVSAAPAPPPAPVIVWPASGPVSGTFGERRGGRGHMGLDLNGEIGDPVSAAAAGTVTWAGPAPAGYGGYGTIVVIDHGEGVETVSAHLSAVRVPAGQRVQPGDLVGAIGVSGNVTGSHLHFEVRVRGAKLDPVQWLPPR